METENEAEHFSNGAFRPFYSAEALRKPLSAPGWCRIWVGRVAGKIVAHASLFDSGHPDFCLGFVGVEKAYRGCGLYRRLQASRLGYCDANNLTLAGAITYENLNAYHVHRSAGYSFLRYDTEHRELWMFRAPVAENGV